MIDPWGTPHVIVFGLESCPWIKHCCTLIFKYDSKHFNWVPVIPKKLCILSNSISWFMESKAFLTSRKTTQFNSPLSMFFSKSSHIRIKADRVECLGRKPDWNLDKSELSAIKWACCDAFQQYLVRAPKFEIFTDYKRLEYLFNNLKSRAPIRIERQILAIQGLDYIVRKGSLTSQIMVLAMLPRENQITTSEPFSLLKKKLVRSYSNLIPKVITLYWREQLRTRTIRVWETS